jgi:hypothetical protein
MIWKARYVPFEPRTPSKAGILLLASAFGVFTEVLKGVKSRARFDSVKGCVYQVSAFGTHGCRFSDTKCKKQTLRILVDMKRFDRFETLNERQEPNEC